MLLTLMTVLFYFVCYFLVDFCFFFFKQKTAYEMRISDWSSDVCSSDLEPDVAPARSARRSDISVDRAVERDLAAERSAAAVHEAVEDRIIAGADEIPRRTGRQKIDVAAGRRGIGRDPVDHILRLGDGGCGRGAADAIRGATAAHDGAGAGALRQRRRAKIRRAPCRERAGGKG